MSYFALTKSHFWCSPSSGFNGWCLGGLLTYKLVCGKVDLGNLKGYSSLLDVLTVWADYIKAERVFYEDATRVDEVFFLKFKLSLLILGNFRVLLWFSASNKFYYNEPQIYILSHHHWISTVWDLRKHIHLEDLHSNPKNTTIYFYTKKFIFFNLFRFSSNQRKEKSKPLNSLKT